MTNTLLWTIAMYVGPIIAFFMFGYLSMWIARRLNK